MAFKLTKSQRDQFNSLLSDLGAEKQAIEQAIEKFNSAVEAAFVEVDAAQTDYNAKLNALREFMQEIESDFRTEFDETSDKWKDGERGQRVLQFIDRWDQEAGDLNDLDIGPPDAIEADPLDTESFDLPTEVD